MFAGSRNLSVALFYCFLRRPKPAATIRGNVDVLIKRHTRNLNFRNRRALMYKIHCMESWIIFKCRQMKRLEIVFVYVKIGKAFDFSHHSSMQQGLFILAI